MSTSAIILIVVSLVIVSDIGIALYFRSLADRVESGEVVRKDFDPAAARKMATMLLVSAPLMWLVVALICFNVIPAGLDPIKF